MKARHQLMYCLNCSINQTCQCLQTSKTGTGYHGYICLYAAHQPIDQSSTGSHFNHFFVIFYFTSNFQIQYSDLFVNQIFETRELAILIVSWVFFISISNLFKISSKCQFIINQNMVSKTFRLFGTLIRDPYRF